MTQQNWILKGYNSDHNKRKITINSLTKHQILRRKHKRKKKRKCFSNLCKYFLFAVKFIQLLFKMARMMTLSFQILNQYFWKHILKKKVLIYVLNISTDVSELSNRFCTSAYAMKHECLIESYFLSYFHFLLQVFYYWLATKMTSIRTNFYFSHT